MSSSDEVCRTRGRGAPPAAASPSLTSSSVSLPASWRTSLLPSAYSLQLTRGRSHGSADLRSAELGNRSRGPVASLQ